jgi:angiotensin-converting enzyme 2
MFNFLNLFFFYKIVNFQEVIDLKGKLPASVLSDMWGRFWNNLYKYVVPYPDKPSIDPTEAMEKKAKIDLN